MAIDTSAAKKEILARIRTAQELAKIDTSGYEVTRNYQRSSDISHEDLKELLIDRLVDYKATVRTCDQSELAETLVSLLEETNSTTVRYAEGLDPSLFSGFSGTAEADDRSSDPRDLDKVDAVVTDSHVSCAETGTICLQSNPTNGRRALTLVPDRHICLVRMDSVVHLVPQMIEKLDRRLPTTMISGPSATSDIELERVEGVHGPRDLIVVIVN
ncbi:lactate utilization protein C [Corynebacterium poyangense]|uniref:Lactate utilization protein C n=1 Tax=Corynebacterium poyangense TaxID=2684405 RepID=A0A7H0SNA6_9CORY|nr:LUD domain-containing protein [Corynebacterium poyangense]QNQ90031.1 lactate utilization protein C [Corynebacterium poyangense]